MTRPSATEERRVVAGTYRVLDEIGAGSMGEVFEAEHVRLGSRVAVKFLKAAALAEPRAVSRFRTEARALAALQSEYVVRVFDCGELPDGTPYLVMERLLGEDLRSLLARTGALPVQRAVRLALDACQGLAAVHGAGVVHRDLKPANLFVTRRDSGAELCKILDFGVAKLVTSDATHQGHLLGTVRYMAPEQLEDASSATEKTDIYSLGAILYEALTGAPVHAAATLQKTMFEVLNGTVRPISQYRAVPARLERAVLRALSKLPGERPSARELSRELRPFANAPGDAASTLSDESLDGRVSLQELPRRGRPVLIAALLAATFGLGLAAGRALDGVPASSPDEASVRVEPAPAPELPAAPVSTAAPPAEPEVSDEPEPPTTPVVRTRPNEPARARAAGLASRFDAKNPYAD